MNTWAVRNADLHRRMAQKWNPPWFFPFFISLWYSRERYQWNMDVAEEYESLTDEKKLEQLNAHTCLCAQHSWCYGDFKREERPYIYK